jgi:hypothetical protein
MPKEPVYVEALFGIVSRVLAADGPPSSGTHGADRDAAQEDPFTRDLPAAGRSDRQGI